MLKRYIVTTVAHFCNPCNFLTIQRDEITVREK